MVALRLRSAGEVGRSAIDIAGASLLNIKRRNHISPCEMCSSGRAPAHQRGLRANSRLASTAATSTSTTGHETEGKEADSRGPAPLVRLESVRLAYPSVHIPSSATCSDIIQPRSSSPISLSVYPPNAEGLGGGHAVLGRNGSGKSLLHLALAHGTSVSGPEHSHLESGTMDMFPDDPNAKTFKSRYPISSVSFDSHHRLLQAGGTGYAALTPLGGRLSKAAEFLVVRFGLFPLLGRDVSTLSTGEIRKVLLVRALATRPSLLLLDNAFDGLDVPSRQSLSDLVSKMLRGFKTDILVQGVSATNAARTQVIMSTHRSEEIVEEIGVISYLGREDSKTGNGIVTEHRAGRSGDVIMRAIHRHESSESSIGDDEEAERDVASSLWNATRQGGSKGASLSSSRDQGFVDRKSWGSAVSGAWNDPEMPSLNAIRSLFQQGREGASASSADPPVRAEQLRVVKDEHTILNNLTWTVAQGDRWLIAGGNGAGKSTLSRLLARKSSVEDESLSLSVDDSNIGWVSTELHMRLAQSDISTRNVLAGNEAPSALQIEFGEKVASWLNIDPVLLSRPFSCLSQGEQKMVLLARAIAGRPRLLIVDEPMQGLDSHNRRRVLGLIELICRATDVSLVYITHHMEELLPCVTHVLHLRGGRDVFQGELGEYEPESIVT